MGKLVIGFARIFSHHFRFERGDPFISFSHILTSRRMVRAGILIGFSDTFNTYIPHLANYASLRFVLGVTFGMSGGFDRMRR